MKKEEFEKLLEEIHAIVTGQMFAYKANPTIGNAYINKERLPLLGGTRMNEILFSAVMNAEKEGLKFEATTKTVVVVGPAYGAINYAPIIAEMIEELYDVRAIPTRTELDRTNDKLHVIPEKLKGLYEEANEFIIIEDIVNGGTTIEQVRDLIRKHINETKKISALCLVDRGKNNSSESMDIEAFYPFLKVDMKVYDPRTDEGIEFLNNSGLVMNIQLGKGKQFIEKYGPGPYKKEQFNA